MTRLIMHRPRRVTGCFSGALMLLAAAFLVGVNVSGFKDRLGHETTGWPFIQERGAVGMPMFFNGLICLVLIYMLGKVIEVFPRIFQFRLLTLLVFTFVMGALATLQIAVTHETSANQKITRDS